MPITDYPDILDRYALWVDEQTRAGLDATPDGFREHERNEEAPARLAAIHAKAKEALDARNSVTLRGDISPTVAIALDRIGDAIVNILMHAEPYVPESERMQRV